MEAPKRGSCKHLQGPESRAGAITWRPSVPTRCPFPSLVPFILEASSLFFSWEEKTAYHLRVSPKVRGCTEILISHPLLSNFKGDKKLIYIWTIVSVLFFPLSFRFISRFFLFQSVSFSTWQNCSFSLLDSIIPSAISLSLFFLNQLRCWGHGGPHLYLITPPSHTCLRSRAGDLGGLETLRPSSHSCLLTSPHWPQRALGFPD